MAPDQAVCPEMDCPIVSWLQNRTHHRTPAGSYLPAEITEVHRQ